ncbi:MAG: hypothetical protein HY300_05370 [Verrucomicrobia bacterium]|nr:hypothetical protein [Verrucomicrobiota bacterium]
MSPKKIMLIAGEPSGDQLAAELVSALKTELAREVEPPRFFGAGGAKMAAAGVELAFDLTQHSVIGLWEVIRSYGKFRALFDQLLRVACERQPDVILCVDFQGFNSRFAAAVQRIVGTQHGPFANWRPRLVQYVSPQVWASRPGRAQSLARNVDLLLSILPFEKDWYAARVPHLRVEFVGNPIVERHGNADCGMRIAESVPASPPQVLLLPGSRVGELKRTGTVTLECAFFGVPTVALYKTSWLTYLIGRQIVTVDYLAMPNLLANELVFPELIQHTATGENIARETLALLNDTSRRAAVKAKLAKVAASLGQPGASARAAKAVLSLLR